MANFWQSDYFKYHMGKKVYDLTADTIKLALVLSTATTPESTWALGVPSVGDVVVPTTRNGHRYICTVSGTNTTEPTWPITDGGEVVGGSATWKEYGGDMCAHDLWADVSGAEASTGTGYTTGGETLANKTLTQTYRDVVWDADDVTWTSLTKTFRYAFIYKSGTDAGIVNPIIAYIMFDESYADKVITGVDFWVQFASTGIITLSRG